MLFAQITEATSWIQIAVNLGAIGILGFYFLRVQPETAASDRAGRLEELRLLASLFADEREAFGERAESIAGELKELGKKPGCKIDERFPGWYRASGPAPTPEHGPGTAG